MSKNTISPQYSYDAEEAARFYARMFPDSAVGADIKLDDFILPIVVFADGGQHCVHYLDRPFPTRYPIVRYRRELRIRGADRADQPDRLVRALQSSGIDTHL